MTIDVSAALLGNLLKLPSTWTVTEPTTIRLTIEGAPREGHCIPVITTEGHGTHIWRTVEGTILGIYEPPRWHVLRDAAYRQYVFGSRLPPPPLDRPDDPPEPWQGA